jgi:hypothetical protein
MLGSVESCFPINIKIKISDDAALHLHHDKEFKDWGKKSGCI